MNRHRRLIGTVSETAKRALGIIQECGLLPPADFARRMWRTDHWMPHAVGPTGGSYLWRLRQMGLINDDGLTDKGRAALAGDAVRLPPREGSG